jgi:hypothetical protein
MTTKEKLKLMADIKKANDQRLKAWIEERKTDNGNRADQ